MQTFLLECAIRATLIAAVIAVVLWAMRIITAAACHKIRAGAVVLMLLLPAWMAWGPKAPLPVLQPQAGQTAFVPLSRQSPAGPMETATGTSPVREDGGYPLPVAVTTIYFAGVDVFLLRLLIGTIRANRLTGDSCVVPVTVGLLHPRMILPKNSREWRQAQMDGVMAPEREHIRRRGPLFQRIALLNRAIFGFHPLAWWLERKLSELGEETFDAAVLARGYDARKYSEYLFDLARSVQRAGMRINAVGTAMPGTGLKHRIRQVMSGVPSRRISRPRWRVRSLCALARR